MIKNILFSFLYFIIYCFPTQAAINTLVSGANWSTATWSLGRIPNNTDDVIIPSGATLSVDIDAICGSLKIANATANTTVNMAAGSSLIIDKTAGRTGNLTFGGSNNTGNYTLNVATGALTISGSVVYGTKGNCRVRVSSGVATIAELITLSGKDFLDFIAPGTGSVYLNGGLIDGAGTLTTLNGSNVYIKNTYTISANTTWAAGSIAFLNSTTINTGGKTLIFANLTLLQGNTTLSGGDIAITGNLEAKTGTNFNASSNTITLSGSYFGVGDLTFTTGTFNVAKDWINTGTFTCGTGTVNY
ncbi:MAG: hypothetical protein IT239_00795, partial [Bacteroidia bacterium]|nr:hypothetical protein [Bacteroidia bacterium]